MNGNFFYSIKNLSRKENLAVSYYLYKICLDVEEYRSFEESQALYNILVSTLGIENHSKKVIQAVIQKHKKAKLLTPKINDDYGTHPFNLRGDIKTYYCNTVDYKIYCNPVSRSFCKNQFHPVKDFNIVSLFPLVEISCPVNT